MKSRTNGRIFFHQNSSEIRMCVSWSCRTGDIFRSFDGLNHMVIIWNSTVVVVVAILRRGGGAVSASLTKAQAKWFYVPVLLREIAKLKLHLKSLQNYIKKQ